jgi:lauroyl/myristoyl acyltransferase
MLPRGLSYAIGDAATWLAWRLMSRTRAAVMDNVSALFPNETESELKQRALRTYRSYARDVVDFLCALRAPGHEAAMLVDVPPERALVFHDLLARGRGIILVGGHYGNWEFGGILMRRVLHLPLTVIAMAEAAGEANRIRREIRDGLGIDTLEVRQSFDTALQIRRCLGENRVVAFLMDRHVGRDRVAVSLLGRPAWFLRTPVLMAYLTGAPLLPCFIERAGPGLFTAWMGTPIEVSTERPRDAAIQRAAQQFADELGERVREHPDYWYHFYRYWDAQREP